MGSISEYHRYLFLGKVTESLDESEEKELQSLFEENEDARKEYDSFLTTLPEYDVSDSFNRVKQPKFWKGHLPAEIVRQRKKALKNVFFGISTMIILGTVLIFSLFNTKKGGQTPAQKIAKEDRPAVQLILSDGEVINLNKEKEEITTSDFKLLNKNGSLTYSDNSGAKGVNSVIVPTGMTYKINLSDGSRVWMNAETKLQFPSVFSDSKREIFISGEAYLEVAKNKAKPFIVRLPASTIQVTGTSFNINTYDPAITRVSLVEGGLNLITDGKKVKVGPGMEAVADGNHNLLYSQAFDIEKTISWRQGLFYFDKASLSEISAVLKRWYGVKTIIERPELNNKRFAGILDKNESIEVFLDNLRNITRVKAQIDKNGVLHFK